jgi:putative peptidoglycan lipid II flippase
VSRVTGVARYAAIGAVLGPTFFGNTYQFTNSLPNLVYYGFLAGSLLSSLLTPALVRHIDAKDRRACERVAGGFLGVTLLVLLAAAPVAILVMPLVLRFAAFGGGSPIIGAAQERVGRWLIMMFIPQVFLYAVVTASTAVMNARRRFALAAAAPALENLGTIGVLAAAALIYGRNAGLGDVSTGEMLLLGFGSTGAVALHAAAQWWGARRAGVTLVPRAGWRDPEVRTVVHRTLPSLAQAGLAALQTLVLLVIANRVAGGVVAFQMALNFYTLAIAIGATPVALSLLPRLARMYLDDQEELFRDTLVRGFALGSFVTIPGAVGYLVLAGPLAHAISFGKMSSSAGVSMVAVSIAALAVAVVAQTVFVIGTYAFYARKDTRTPLVSMAVQAAVCLCLVGGAFLARDATVLLALGLAFSVAVASGATHLVLRMRKHLQGGRERLGPSLIKVLIGTGIMAGPTWVAATFVPRLMSQTLGALVGVVLAVLLGTGIYVFVQVLLKTPELGWIAGGLVHLRRKARHTVAEVSHG